MTLRPNPDVRETGSLTDTYCYDGEAEPAPGDAAPGPDHVINRADRLATLTEARQQPGA